MEAIPLKKLIKNQQDLLFLGLFQFYSFYASLILFFNIFLMNDLQIFSPTENHNIFLITRESLDRWQAVKRK